jgi:oxygen-dependent protoporphyrinogen oxidase
MSVAQPAVLPGRPNKVSSRNRRCSLMSTEASITAADKTRIVIIGGGITGLAAAHRLLENGAQTGRNLDVLLLEAGSRLGGVLHSFERDGFLLEAGADSFISEKPEAVALARRLGIEDRLIQTNESYRRSFIVREGKLRPVPEGFQLLAPTRFWPFVTTDIFSWAGKARMALDLFLPRRPDTNGNEEESLAQFVRRRLGREAFERMAQPMIGGIYTADPEKLSLRATLPRFLEMERAHRSIIHAMWKQRRSNSATVNQRHSQRTSSTSGVSGARYSLFLSFDRGLQVLVDKQSSRLNAVVRLNAKAESLILNQPSRRWQIRLQDKTTVDADAVCLALPAYAAATLIGETDAELSDLLNRIPFASTATINLAYRRREVPHPLDGFGFVVPFIENRSLLACTFSSVKFAGRAPADHVLLRAFAGGALQPEIFELDEDELLRRVRQDLRDLLGIEAPPLFTVIEKWRRSMPQYHVGHLRLVAEIQARAGNFPGLELAGNSFAGAGVPDCIRSGEQAAESILNQMRGRASEH